MFMFRSRKTNLAKRLMKKRRGGTGGTGGGNEAARRATEDEAVSESVDNLLKTLQENQLEMLLRAVDSRGQDVSNCVLVPQKAGEDPHVLCCQTWRWPDLRQGNKLRRLPMCRSACDPVYICCNPYHWSRLCQPETPPPPYSRTNEDRIRPEDRAPSEVPFLYRDSFPSSLTTDGDCCMNPAEWCKLAYWELSERVGSMFVVDHPAVNVFGGTGVLCPDGLSLQILAKDRINPNEPSIQKTRSKIGLGVTLWREDDCCVWVYNRSGYPIFVNSTTLEIPESPSAPTKVPEEHCLCVYDPVKAAQQNFGWNFAHPQYGPVDPNSIRISFVKGWGPKYSRQEITSCPCWLEILLAPCR